MKTFLLLICLLPTIAVAQNTVKYHTDILENDTSSINTRINSINAILDKQKDRLEDTVVVDFYLQLADLYRDNQDFGSAVLYCDTILEEFKKLDFYKRKDIEIKRAMYFKSAGKTEKCIKGLLKVLSEYEDHDDFDESAKLNKNIGVIFLKMNDLKNAEYHLKESIQQARKVGDAETEGYSLMSLGNRFKKEAKYKEAEERYKQSIAIAKREDIKRLLAGNYNNYGSLYRMMKKPERAMEYYKMAVKMNKEIGNDKWLSYNYNNLGNIYNEKKNYGEALRYFSLSLQIKKRINDYRGMVQTLSNIAGVEASLGNYPAAYRYQLRHQKLSDSIEKLDDADESKRLAAEFQAEKREAQIMKLHMQDELNQQELKAQGQRISYQNRIGWILGIGIFLIFVIAIFLLWSMINRKKINKELVSKNQQIDEQHNEIIDSINYAKRIQNSILPGTERLKRLLHNYGVWYKPKDIISGDFYICDGTNDGVYFGTVDCTGHGVPGAMVSLVASSHFNKMLHELKLKEPGQILNQLNREVPDALAVENEVINDGMDMSLCFVDNDRKQLKFSGAYQNCWILNRTEKIIGREVQGSSAIHDGGQWSIIELKGERQGIGKTTSKKEFTTLEAKLEKGDKILMSTDGYQDQFGGPNNKKFKVKEMRRIVLENGDKSPQELIDLLIKAMRDWQAGYDQVDDICVMIVEA